MHQIGGNDPTQVESGFSNRDRADYESMNANPGAGLQLVQQRYEGTETENETRSIVDDEEGVANTLDSTTEPLLRPSIPESFRSIRVAAADAAWWQKLYSYAGPGILIAVGYMDPGNWSTDMAGGSLYNYDLLFVILLSSLCAMFLQSLTVRLGVSTGRDLAQLCRENYPDFVAYCLWFIFEVAIAATDLAEVIGSAIGLKLLFGIPLVAGVCLTVFDVLLVMFLYRGKMRVIESLVAFLVSVITICFVVEMVYSRPDVKELLHGYIPKARLITDPGRLFIGIGIIGATVMPHNLFLHSSLVLTRASRTDVEGQREAIKYATIDSCINLVGAFFVNCFILIVAASAFHKNGIYDVASLEEAYHMLDNVLGKKAASVLFGVALLASGQSSTFTGTFAGQIVMEGFLNFRMGPMARRITTRTIAIIPALLAIIIGGDRQVDNLLILSQVILSFALPFAVFPLVQFTSEPSMMGVFVSNNEEKCLAYIVFVILSVLNVYLLVTGDF
mmetsp:Transcript_33445/g.34082  ORF Transcript_33445/g.34082 Transcript_33445/m.34082 type:complete len:503 (+) Transcript_33445:275-1783(+)|eukprot:CAMPEP_0182431212 /NCGR_PEP_ID=MMETSP1167-20130531/47319_1 /TAXON_ID=2988 /ORGANISM="Mallomonas Sp, Strain CCMP3275" /LENGTH=502 /DNA_ID=CAMNT_0024617287 /DNA_START=196 /DNA_END=1704 /DNA_ORIENTATION=-